MRAFFYVQLTVLILISGSVLSQSKLTAEFDTYEMLLKVNDRIVDLSVVGFDCELTYIYNEKFYRFACKTKANKNTLYQFFYQTEIINNEIYVGLTKYYEIDSRFKLNNNLFHKGEISLVNEKIEENGDKVELIYRFYNKK